MCSPSPSRKRTSGFGSCIEADRTHIERACRGQTRVESVTAGPDGAKVVEDFAQKALESERLWVEDFELLAELVRVHVKGIFDEVDVARETFYLLGVWCLGPWRVLWGYETYPKASLTMQVCQ